MKAYALTLYAYKWPIGENLTASYGTNVGIATDDKTMRAIALEKCLEDFPKDEGYQGHQVSLMRIDNKLIETNGKQYTLQIVKEKAEDV